MPMKMIRLCLVWCVFGWSHVVGFTPAAPSRMVPADATTRLASLPSPFDTLTSGLASIARLPRGVTVVTKDNPNSNSRITIERLWDVENDRDCRLVRERLTELDLSVEVVVPSTPNSRAVTQADYTYALPSSAVLPALQVRDSNGEPRVLAGAEAILQYLDVKFPNLDEVVDDDDDLSQAKEIAKQLWQDVGGLAPGLLRWGRGSAVSTAVATSAAPSQPLVLYSYEGNQFCRLVREVLCELDLPYEMRNTGKESPQRAKLAALTPNGSSQCPYLLDPNTDTSMPESVDICAYLYQTYATFTPPNGQLRWISDKVLFLAKPLFAVLTPLQAKNKEEEDESYLLRLEEARMQIQKVTQEHPVVVYTYDWSPFSTECCTVLDRLQVNYHTVSLGPEWLPGLLREPMTRAALLDTTGQSSLPHIFVGGESIGGLFSGTPGLVPMLEEGTFQVKVESALNNPPMPDLSPLPVQSTE